MSNKGVIGFFDSGVGGLTIWREVIKELPNENTVYLADSQNAPYGERSKEKIIELSIRNTEYLINQGAKIIVVACNTATTQAISVLRQKFRIPFIGIEPAIKPAAQQSKTKCIGVLATNGTIESEHFNKAKDHYSNDVKVVTQVGEGLVTAIENGGIQSEELIQILSQHLNELTQHPIDHLVLGCTHYPLLIPLIKELIGDKIKLVDPCKPVAKQAKRVLVENKCEYPNLGTVNHRMVSTGSLEILESICSNNLKLPHLDISYSSLYQSE